MSVEFRAVRRPEYLIDGVDLYILDRERKEYGADIVFAPLPTEGTSFTAAAHLTPEEAQQLTDALWEAGARPTNGAGSTGQLAATEYHLEDMRRLVFRGKP